MKVKTTNIVELTPLNPNVSLGKDDFLLRAMFPVDDKLKNLVQSDEFQQLLLTDASTDDGQAFLATYYGIDDWANIKQRLIIDKGVNLASRYYYLLHLVKVQSKKDNVWISFYEGLHRHASLLITLLSAVFNTTTNILKFNTLTVDYFKQHQLPNFKSDNETPHERLNKIFQRKISAPMLTEPFPIKCIIPLKVEGVPPQGSVSEFTRRLCRYSELISDMKKTSAANTTFSLLSRALNNELNLCNREDSNREDKSIIAEHRYTIQTQIKGKTHGEKMKSHKNDDKEVYGWCDLLDTDEWHIFSKDPLDDNKRARFLDKMTYRSSDYAILDINSPGFESALVNSYPPYGISYKSMSIDVGDVIKSRRKVDPRHYNAFDLLPRIITILHAKETNELISKTAQKQSNTAMINFVCRYGYGTREYNQNSLHAAALRYLPDIYTDNSYLNNCKGIYQVMPVAVFLMTCYNAGFMFQIDKTDNLMIETLQRLDLIPNLDNASVLQTFSKWSFSTFNTESVLNVMSLTSSYFFDTDAISWYHIDVSFIIGEKIARKKVKPIFPDRGQPGFFKEIVQHWVAFDLVQIFHRYGLKPTFNESLCEWSKDLHSLVVVLSKNNPTTEDRDIAERCLSTLFDVAITEHWASFPRAEFGTKQNFKKIQNFAIPLVILTWNRMLQEYFMKDPEHTFFGLGDYREQKKKEKDAPYDNLFMSANDDMEFKVNSFTCFQPNKNLMSSPVVCPSLLRWAEYLLSPAMETDEQKKERLHKLGEKPMKQYNMTHTSLKSQSRPTRENTADVVTTPSKELGNSGTATGKSKTTIALQQRENIDFLEVVADMITSPNDSTEEEEPTSVMLLYRIGEALQAAERTHVSISQKRKPVGFEHNEAKVKDGIASFVQLVKSVNQGDSRLDFEAAMDWLGRESKTGDSLIIDLTRPDNHDSSSDDSSASSEHSSYDSDYLDRDGDSKPRHKKRTSQNKQKNSDEGDCPPDGNTNLNTLTSVCGDANETKSDDDEEEISVNESNESNNILPEYMLNVLYGKSTLHDEVDNDGVQDEQQHQDKSGGLQETQDSVEDEEDEDDGVQEGQQHRDSGELHKDEDDGVKNRQQHRDKSSGLEEEQDSDEEQQDDRPGKTGEDTLTKSQRKRLRKKERETQKRKRDQEEDRDGVHDSNRNSRQVDSAEKVDKQRKKKKKRKKKSSDGI